MSRVVILFNGSKYIVNFDCDPPGEIINALAKGAEPGSFKVYDDKGVEIFKNVTSPNPMETVEKTQPLQKEPGGTEKTSE